MNLNVETVLAVNTLIFHGYKFEETFAEIHKLGFLYVEPALISSYYPEIDDNYFSQKKHIKQLNSLISANGLRVIAVGAHIDLGEKKAAESFRKRMAFAKGLGAQYIHTNSTENKNYSAFLNNLEKLLPLAESLKLVITLENPGDGENNILDTGEKGAILIKKMGSPYLRLNYDFSNVYSYSKGKIKPENDFKKALPFTAHMHLKEIQAHGKEWRFVAIGQGITDYESIFYYLSQNKILLPMSIELPIRFKRGSDFKIKYDPKSQIPSIAEIRKVLKDSRDFISKKLS